MSSTWSRNESNDCKRVHVSNLLNSTTMMEQDTAFLDIDDVAMMAAGLLDQFRDRGMNDTLQRNVANRALDQNNLEKLRSLVAKFKADIRAHDAKVAEAQLALSGAAGSEGCEAESSFPPPRSESASEMSAAEDNTRGSGTIPKGDTRIRGRRDLSHRRANQTISVLAAARAIGGAARKAAPLLSPVQIKLAEFRKFAFEKGRKLLQEGDLNQTRLAAVIKEYRTLHPDAPASLRSTITTEGWKAAVRENNIDMLTMARSVAEVKTKTTLEEKLNIRSDLRPLIDWCITWIQSERKAGRSPTLTRMEAECKRLMKTGDLSYQFNGVTYAKDAIGLRWRHLLEYESRGEADSHIEDDIGEGAEAVDLGELLPCAKADGGGGDDGNSVWLQASAAALLESPDSGPPSAANGEEAGGCGGGVGLAAEPAAASASGSEKGGPGPGPGHAG